MREKRAIRESPLPVSHTLSEEGGMQVNSLERMMLEVALKAVCPTLEIRRDEPMSAHTSFRVGGPAALMVLPKNKNEVELAVRAAATQYVKPFFLGNGSNLLVSDAGYDGLVVKTTGLDRIQQIENKLWAEGGALLSRVAHAAAECGRTGLEFAAGIPGTVGGAVTMNAGAYGGEMAQVVKSVTYLDENGETHQISGQNCEFSYRKSLFAGHPGWFILGAEVALETGDPEDIKAKMAELSAQRKAKQPLEFPSAGSTFKRPAPLPDGTPVYAAALIDQCGLKGFTVGGAQVSEKHAGFVINRGGATCADILAVIEEVKKRVLNQTGVALELEVKTLGV